MALHQHGNSVNSSIFTSSHITIMHHHHSTQPLHIHYPLSAEHNPIIALAIDTMHPVQLPPSIILLDSSQQPEIIIVTGITNNEAFESE
jgi:hypothetical protein